MAKASKSTGRFTPEQIQLFLQQGEIKTMADVQSALKDLFGQTLQAMLEGEMDHHLGYEKHSRSATELPGRRESEASGLGDQDPDGAQARNRRNGHGAKSVRSEYGDLALTVPRDRDGSFEPLIVQKRQKTVTGIEDQVLALYAKGVSCRDIQDHLEHLYGVEVSPTFISNVTDKVLPQIQAWQSRPLATTYALVFLDAIHFKVRHEGRIQSKAAYMVIGVDLEGMKEVLGIWIGEAESAKFWLSVLSELKNRGTSDILICCVDNLTGFSEAIAAVFPLTQVQKCIVHQVRNSLRYVSSKDRQPVAQALRLVYTAPTEAAALAELEEFDQEWGKKYPLAVSSWRANWPELATFFSFAPDLRRLIYMTNMIESYHRQLRKVTKGKSLFPNDESLLKMLYLATCDVQRRWTMRIAHWGQILAQLTIVYPDRIKMPN
jgi:transposase-like protein